MTTRTWADPKQTSLLPDPIDVRFRAFHHANPHVLTRIVQLAREMRAHGVQRGSMETIFGKLRWEHALETTGDIFRLNDHYTSRYSRLVMALHPDLDGFFTTRLTNADRTST